MAIRSTRTIELPKNGGKTDDEIRTQHQRRKYGDDQYRIKKVGSFNFDRSIKFVSKRGKRITNSRFICWGCDLFFSEGFAYLTQVGTVYFCHKCKAQAVPFATVDIGQIALQGGKADSGR